MDKETRDFQLEVLGLGWFVWVFFLYRFYNKKMYVLNPASRAV